MVHTPRLIYFSHDPCGKQLGRCHVAKWDAPSLPLLNGLSITSLCLYRLSQSGTRALSTLLSTLGEDSVLETLVIDFVWLDDQVCEAVGKAGRKLRSLVIGTSGTKLSDKGIVTIVESCDALEELVLDEVQGDDSRQPSHTYARINSIL